MTHERAARALVRENDRHSKRIMRILRSCGIPPDERSYRYLSQPDVRRKQVRQYADILREAEEKLREHEEGEQNLG